MILFPYLAFAEPWSVSEKSPVITEKKEIPPPAFAGGRDDNFARGDDRRSFWNNRFDYGYYFYQKVISPADGARCGMVPTCADYGYQAMRKHGLMMGTWMSTDRFMRDHGHNEGPYDFIEKYGKRRFFDPLHENDFWFSREKNILRARVLSKAAYPPPFSMGAPPLLAPPATKSLSPKNISPSANDSPNTLRQFADTLFHEEDYYRAITEYKRFIFLYPAHPKAKETKFLIGFSYLKGEKWDAAISAFSEIFSEKVEFLIGQAHFFANRYAAARSEWASFLEKYPKSKLKDATHYQIGWSYFLEETHEKAKEEFKKVGTPAGGGSTLKSHANKMIEEIDQWEEHPRRSPFLAGTLSAIVPGSGQWYTGRFWDGLSALVLNGIFAYGIYKTFDAKLYPASGILIFFGLGFYGGNIFFAVLGAHKFNRNIKESQWQRLKNRHRLHLEWRGNSLNFRFP